MRRLLCIFGSCVLLAGLSLWAWHAWSARQVRLRQQAFDAGWSALADNDLPRLRVAIDTLAELSATDTEECQLLVSGAVLRAGQPQVSLKRLQAISSRSPLYLKARLLIAECQFKLGRIDQAIPLLLEVVEREPDNIAAHRWLVTSYHELGQMYAAMDELRTIVKLNPDDAAAYRLMGLMYKEDVRNAKRAIQAYEEALKHRPAPDLDRQIRREFGEILVDQRSFEQALQVLEPAAGDALAAALRAECHWALGSRDQVDEWLKRARAPGVAPRRARLLECRLALADGRSTEAVRIARELLKADPHDTEAKYQLLGGLRQLGETDEADRETQSLERSKALIHEMHKLYDEAIKQPLNADLRDKLAELCEKLDQPKLAQTWRRAAENCRRLATVFSP